MNQLWLWEGLTVDYGKPIALGLGLLNIGFAKNPGKPWVPAIIYLTGHIEEYLGGAAHTDRKEALRWAEFVWQRRVKAGRGVAKR